MSVSTLHASAGSVPDEFTKYLAQLDREVTALKKQLPAHKKFRRTPRAAHVHKKILSLLKEKVAIDGELERLKQPGESYDPDFLRALKAERLEAFRAEDLKFHDRFVDKSRSKKMGKLLCAMVICAAFLPSAAALGTYHDARDYQTEDITSARNSSMVFNNATCSLAASSSHASSPPQASSSSFFIPPYPSTAIFPIDAYAGKFSSLESLGYSRDCAVDSRENCAMRGQDSDGHLFFAKRFGEYDTKALAQDVLLSHEMRFTNMAHALIGSPMPLARVDSDANLLIQELVPLDAQETARIFEAAEPPHNEVRGKPWNHMSPRQREEYLVTLAVDLLIDNLDNHRKQFGVTPEGTIVEFDRGRAFWKLVTGDNSEFDYVLSTKDHLNLIETRLRTGLFRRTDLSFCTMNVANWFLNHLNYIDQAERERILASTTWHNFGEKLRGIDLEQFESWIGPVVDHLGSLLVANGRTFDRAKALALSFKTMREFDGLVEAYLRR